VVGLQGLGAMLDRQMQPALARAARLTMKGAFMCRVLIPTDLSEAALRVTGEIASWADTVGGELLLLHVVPDIYIGWLDQLALSFIDQARLEAAYGELRERGRRMVSTWLPPTLQDRCGTIVAVGGLVNTILTVAQEERVDAIILRAAKRRRWLPSRGNCVAEAVKRKASLPVLIWDGVANIASVGLWPDAQRLPAGDRLHKATWRSRSSTPGKPTEVLKSC
jgi:nucleotide-binding universal stress UspA family protein